MQPNYYFVGITKDEKIYFGFEKSLGSNLGQKGEVILSPNDAREIAKLFEASVKILEERNASNKANDSGEIREGSA